jgi:hypothetical protein
MDKEIERLLGEWLAATNEGNAKNKIAERIGELCADEEIERRFGAQLKSVVAIPRRGEEGVVILDLAYELEGNAFVIAESKFNTSQKGKLVQRIIAADDVVGEAQILTVEGGITQLEGRWVIDRISEVEKQDYRLALKLDEARKDLRLVVLEVRTVPEIKDGKALIKEIKVTDHTETLNRFTRGLPVERTAKQQLNRSVAKRLAADKSAAETSAKVAKDLRAKADKATNKAEELRKKAEKSRQSVNATEKPDIKAKREKIASDAEKAYQQADAEARAATEAAVRAENSASALAGVTGAADRQKILDAIRKANELDRKAVQAADDAKKAAEALVKAKDHLAAAKRSDSRRRRGKLVQDAEETAKKAEEQAKLAKQAADTAKQQLKQLVGHDPRATASRKTVDPGAQSKATDAKFAKGAKPPPTADTNAAQNADELSHTQPAARTAEDAAAQKAADEAAAKKAAATANKANTAKVLESRATASKGLATAAQPAKELEVGSKALELAKAADKVVGEVGKAKFVMKFAFKGTRMVAKIGRFVFLMMEVPGLNLLGDLLLLVDLVDFIVDWLQREKKAREREWERIANYLFGPTSVVTSDWNVTYITSMQGAVLFAIQSKITSPADPQNFLFWMTKWNNEPGWDGFVYSQIEWRLEKQARVRSDDDEPGAVKYRPAGPLKATLTAVPPEDSLTETPLGIVKESDPANMTTGGSTTPDPQRVGTRRWTFSDAEKSWLDVRFTQPIPCLTPFDFILVKCRMLSSAIIGFVAKYDGQIDKNIDDLISEDFVDQFLKQDIFKGRTFGQPLNDNVIHTSMSFLFNMAKALEQSRPQGTDFQPYKDNPKYNTGLFRRQKLLLDLYRTGSPGPPQLVKNLNQILTRTVAADLVKPVDLELKDLDTDYLYELATQIYADLKRAAESLAKRPYLYQYKGPEQRAPNPAGKN